MKTYICHCTAQMYDQGFKTSTTCRPTIIVEASSEFETGQQAESKFIKEQLQGRKLNSFTIAIIKEI